MMSTSIFTRNTCRALWCAAMTATAVAGAATEATQSRKMPVIPKWDRLELTFKSTVTYTNPVQQADLTVRFTGPMGQTAHVYGFWDGGKVWCARFSPDQVGHWTFQTTCSDVENAGLHEQTGEFLCTAATGQSRFNQHGQVRLAASRRQFEHLDGTPFFWLADTVWSGPRVSSLRDWDYYARARAMQDFTVAQWAVAPGKDLKERTAFSGPGARIVIHPDFFQRLDWKLDRLSREGILSAITPLLELDTQAEAAAPLPEDQAILLARYVVARWGADPVVWLVAFDGNSAAKNVERWKRIGQSVFGPGQHAPVLLYPGKTPSLLDQFRDQRWVDALGVEIIPDLTDDALKRTFSGPFPTEWTKNPPRPVIAFTPCENTLGAQSKQRFSALDVRRAAYCGLLMTVPAGVSYGAKGVLNWDQQIVPLGSKEPTAGMPMWQVSLSIPGAREMMYLARLAGRPGFLRLRPDPGMVTAQPGNLAPRRYVAAARTDAKDLAVVYVPEERTVEVLLDGLPPAPVVTWFNPRKDANSPAVAVVGPRSCQFPTPEPGDWVLLLKAGK